MSPVVADASAILAILLDEPGGSTAVRRVSGGAFVSAVNWAEIVTRLSRVGHPGRHWRTEIERRAGQRILEVVPFDEHLADLAGALHPTTSRRGLSLGDRACLALARDLGVPAITADRAWADLDLGIAVEVVR